MGKRLKPLQGLPYSSANFLCCRVWLAAERFLILSQAGGITADSGNGELWLTVKFRP